MKTTSLKNYTPHCHHPHHRSPLSLLILILVLILAFLAPIPNPQSLKARALTKYATDSTTVSAAVPKNAPPSTPILIAPANNSILTDNTPEFIWTESTDDRQMNKYQFYLDGSLLYDNIPLTNTNNPGYTTNYDSSTGYYYLTPKSKIDDGLHTWKIHAVDVLDSHAKSTTWNFTIDTAIQKTTGEIFPPISQLATAIPRETKKFITIGYKLMTPWLALLVALALPIITILIIASKFKRPLSLPLFQKIAQAVGILPSGSPQGIVFDDESNEGVAFGLVTIISQDEHRLYRDSAITDHNGFYRGIKLPQGKYRLSSREESYLFPSNKPQSPATNYYTGQTFEITSENILPILLVPSTKISYDKNYRILEQVRTFLAQLNTYPPLFLLLMTAITGIISIIYPLPSNWLVVSGYGLLWGKKAYDKFVLKPVFGIVIDTDTTPLAKTIIKTQPLASKDHPKTRYKIEKPGSVMISDKNGQFKINSPTPFELTISHMRYHWLEAENHENKHLGDALTKDTLLIDKIPPVVDTKTKEKKLTVVMRKSGSIE